MREDARPGPLVDAFQDSWCHGNTGIALSQLASLSWVDTPPVREQLARTLSYLDTLSQPEAFARKAEDDLCCGNMGRADVLLQASLVLGEARWREAAQALATRVWQRARSTGRYEVSASRGADVFAPSLFQGVAGVGYVFLRLAAPQALPCVLFLE
jgi:lantibiotic modifying enzyme